MEERGEMDIGHEELIQDISACFGFSYEEVKTCIEENSIDISDGSGSWPLIESIVNKIYEKKS